VFNIRVFEDDFLLVTLYCDSWQDAATAALTWTELFGEVCYAQPA